MKRVGWRICLLAVLSWTGCAPKPMVRPPVVEQPAAPPSELGVWENLGSGAAHRKMIFEPGGRLTFQSGLEFFNPGRWELDSSRQELILTLPAADVDKLQIFQMYVGQGVKAFDPRRKQITYHYDADTGILNVGGWDYSRAGPGAAAQPPPEPVIQ